MFFIMGINNGIKKLRFMQSAVCPCCGCSSQLEAFKTFTYFMFFFIPLFRWNKRYYLKMSCCNAICEIDKELGAALEKGEVDNIDPEDFNFSYSNGSSGGGFNSGFNSGAPGSGSYNSSGTGPISARANMNAAPPKTDFANSYVDDDGLTRVKIKTCENCGYETGEDFDFCPKCGRKL